MIRRLGDWWNCLSDIWLVKTALPVEVVRDQLQSLLQESDSVLVLEVGTDASWIGLERQAAGWVKDNLLTHGASPLARTRVRPECPAADSSAALKDTSEACV